MSGLVAACSFLGTRDIVSSLRPHLSHGAVIYSPSSPQWANESARWSTYDQPSFVNVVVPATESDIVATVKYATSNGIDFLAQGGGHGYSDTLKVITDAIMINLKDNFNYAIADTPTTMRVGGGTVFGTLIPALYNAGRELRAPTALILSSWLTFKAVGVSPCVGATGATIGGGLGRLGGLHGLMLDAVSSFRMVLATGKIVNVSSTSYPDLFYGMRGAGQLYGVIIETVFNTYPASNGGNFYNVDMVFPGSQLESTLDVVNKIIPNQPGELALIVLFTAGSPDPEIKVNLVYAGSRSAGLRYSRMFNASLPSSFEESMITFADLPAKSAGGAFSFACAKGARANNYSVNMKYFNLTTFRTVFNEFSTFITTYPSAANSAWLIEIFGQQGELSHPVSSSAYPHRGYDNIRPIIGTAYTDDSVAEAADAYLRSVRDKCNATSGYGPMRVYQNYAHGDEPLEALYGYEKDQLRRLRCLKAKYDGGDVFKGYHDIPKARRGEC